MDGPGAGPGAGPAGGAGGVADPRGRPGARGAWPPAPPPGPYLAALGGSETAGRGVRDPWPAQLAAAVGLPCLNLGVHNASAEAPLACVATLAAARGAALPIVSATGAAGLSNRLYRVHPHRNDRYLKPADALRVIFPEVDFAEVCFVRHLLLTLHAASPERFEVVVDELRIAWVARMRALLGRVGAPAILLWIEPMHDVEGPLGPEPAYVTRPMVEALAPLLAGVVTVPGRLSGEAPEAVHARAAEALAPAVRQRLPPREALRIPA